MILDLISRLSLYENIIPGASAIAAAYAAGDPAAAPCEVREKSYALKDDDKRRFEVHGHTIDLMMAQEGAEEIALCPFAELELAEALPNGGDGYKMNGAPRGTRVRLDAGFFCAILPGEAHMVGGKVSGAESLRKWVVKVPCPEALCVEVHG